MTDDKNFLGLATIRRNRGISLRQIAESTKIGVRALEAIEQGEFQKLPGGIHTVAKRLGRSRIPARPVAATEKT